MENHSVNQEDSTAMKSEPNFPMVSGNNVSFVATSSSSGPIPQAVNILTTTGASLNEARDKLIKGALYVVDKVSPTLGPSGTSAVIQANLRPGHIVVDDGRKIAEAIYLEDSLENMGASLMKEIALQADKESADGTTTATVIAGAILKEAQAKNLYGIKVKRELDEALKVALASIDQQTRQIELSDVEKVALTSSGMPEIAALFGEMYEKIGREGIVELDNSNLPKTHYEIIDGIRIRNAGYLGQYSCTEAGKAVYKNPKVLISKEKITSVDQIEGIVEKLVAQGNHELVIYCEEIDMSVASRLALTHLNGGFKTLIIQAPTLWKDWLYEDLALLTGATPIDQSNGKTFKNVTVGDLGTCEKIISTVDETRVLGTKDVSEHIEALKETGKTDDQQLVRASWLATKVAVLKVGAGSESELSQKRAKVQDAIGATHLALEGGIVDGGGLCFLHAMTGNHLLDVALEAPYDQISKNNGETHADISPDVVDAAKVVKNSLSAAVATAGTILTASSVIPFPKPDPIVLLKQALSMPAL